MLCSSTNVERKVGKMWKELLNSFPHFFPFFFALFLSTFVLSNSSHFFPTFLSTSVDEHSNYPEIFFFLKVQDGNKVILYSRIPFEFELCKSSW